MANQLDANRLENTFENVEAWLLANELLDAAAGVVLEPVKEADLVEIVASYEEGIEVGSPFVVVEEPIFVERRKAYAGS